MQPVQRAWWTHVLRFYNKAVSERGRQSSPLMAVALAADIQLAAREGERPKTWSGQVLAALGALGRETKAPAGQRLAEEMQHAFL